MWSCWIFPDPNPPRPTLPCRTSYLESMAGSIVAAPHGDAADALRGL
jgi:hypothetical protein